MGIAGDVDWSAVKLLGDDFSGGEEHDLGRGNIICIVCAMGE